MKNILKNIGICIVSVLLAPILMFLCIGYLIYVPFDKMRYHKMPYYKDFGNKYEYFITSRDVVKLYNCIIDKQLPIEYIRNDKYEYFIKDGMVLICGWGNENIIKHTNGEWVFVLENSDAEIDGPDNTQITMEEVLSEEKELLKPEHKALPTKFLVFCDNITDAEKFDNAKDCPYFHYVFTYEDIR